MSAHGNDEHETVRGIVPGSDVELEVFGAYRIVRPLRIGRGADLYVARRVRHPSSPDLDVPASVVLKLHKSEPGSAITHLPDDTLVMKPLVRAKVGWHVVDVMTESSTDLYQWWASRGTGVTERRVEPDVVLALAIPMAAAVALAHSDRDVDRVGVIHGDIKLGQFLLSDLGVQLSDWDNSVVRSTKSDGPREVEFETPSVPATAATWAYLPPWGLPERTSVRYDTWALLVCWHQLLAGRHPAEVYADKPFKTQLPIFEAVRKGHWRVDESLDPWWTDFLIRHMNAAPDSRPTAGDLANELIERAATLMRIRFPPDGLTSHGPLMMVRLRDDDILAVSVDRTGRVSSRLHYEDDDAVQMMQAIGRMADRAERSDDRRRRLKAEHEQLLSTLLSDLRSFRLEMNESTDSPEMSADVREELLATLNDAHEKLQRNRRELDAASPSADPRGREGLGAEGCTGDGEEPRHLPAGWRCSECGTVDDGTRHISCGEADVPRTAPSNGVLASSGPSPTLGELAELSELPRYSPGSAARPNRTPRLAGTMVLMLVGVVAALAGLSVWHNWVRPGADTSSAKPSGAIDSALTTAAPTQMQTVDKNVVAPPADVVQHISGVNTLQVDEGRQAEFTPLAVKRVAGRIVVSTRLLAVSGTGQPDKITWACDRPTPTIDSEKTIAPGVYLLVDGLVTDSYAADSPENWGFDGPTFAQSNFYALSAACGTISPNADLGTTWPAVTLGETRWTSKPGAPRRAEFVMPGPRTGQNEPTSLRGRPIYGILLITEARRMIFSSGAFKAAAQD